MQPAILVEDGEKFFKRGSHLPLTKKEMLMWARHPHRDDLYCKRCIEKHYLACERKLRGA